MGGGTVGRDRDRHDAKAALPAEQVIWVVLGMALFRDRPLEDFVSKLDLALPSDGRTIARSSIAQARKKLGSKPLQPCARRSRPFND